MLNKQQILKRLEEISSFHNTVHLLPAFYFAGASFPVGYILTGITTLLIAPKLLDPSNYRIKPKNNFFFKLGLNALAGLAIGACLITHKHFFIKLGYSLIISCINQIAMVTRKQYYNEKLQEIEEIEQSPQYKAEEAKKIMEEDLKHSFLEIKSQENNKQSKIEGEYKNDRFTK